MRSQEILARYDWTTAPTEQKHKFTPKDFLGDYGDFIEVMHPITKKIYSLPYKDRVFFPGGILQA